MPDLFQLVRSVDAGRFIELRVDAGDGRQVDDGTPAEALPDLGDELQLFHGGWTFQFRDQPDPSDRSQQAESEGERKQSLVKGGAYNEKKKQRNGGERTHDRGPGRENLPGGK